MFKLESYITPIILSYVEKYVKNIRAEHSQVSLWGGDVSFSNLDLHLDVLEQELHLPFSFVSGHIHELQIHVPWTRLHAEPIVITINTIECVLKLPGDDDFTGDSVDSSSVGSTGDGSAGTISKRSRKRPKQPETPEAPPGYVQSLINKIISNVSIECNNLILKYVEEDIVLSLNTRNLRLSSANELWEQAFTELSLPDLILRKLLKVTDLTICLDKRNASGKIETYQEPLLYRCSFMVHAAWCYDSINAKIPRISRYEIKCPKLDFSLTDTQIPMFMRILRLMLALYYGEIAQRNRKRIEHEVEDDHPDVNEIPEDGGMGGSWTGWAWNAGLSMGSALLPIYWDDEDVDTDVPPLDVKRDKVLHMGVFIDQASLVFKLTEQQPEKGVFGSAKQIFTPFARFDCSGMFQEVIVKGVGLVNVSLGVSETLFSPVGECLCGRIDTKNNNEPEIPFIKSGEPGQRKHLRGSLFEKDFGDENGPAPKERRRSYAINWDTHLRELPEDKMLERTASMAMDYLYFMDIPDEMTSEQLSEVGLDLENSNMAERALCRVVVGPIKIGVCSGLLHRLEIIQHLASKYDYLPYVLPEKNPDQENFPVPKKEEVEQLIQGTPFRVYQIMAINPVVHLFVSDHPKLVSFKKSGLGIRTSNFEKLPCLVTKLDIFDAQLSTPMYPTRLIRMVVSMSSQFASTLIQNCYTKMSAKVTGLTSLLCLEDQFTTVFQGTLFQCSWKKLLRPDSWSDVTTILSEWQLDVSSLKFRFTHPQVKAILGIINSHLDNNPKSMRLSDSSLMEDALTKRMSSLVLNTTGIHGQYCETKTVRYVHVVVENMGISLTEMGPDALKQIPILTRLSPNHPVMMNLQRSPMKMSPGRAQTKSMTGGKVTFESDSSGEPLLSFHAQVPLTDEISVCPSLVLGHICQFDVCLDPKLMDWLVYVPSIKFGLAPKEGPSVKIRSDPMASDVNLTRSFSGKTGTSDRKTGIGSSHKRSKQTVSGLSALSQTICHWFPTLNSMLVQIRVEGQHIYLPQKSIGDFASKTVLESVQRATKNDPSFSILCVALPSVSLENVTHKPMIQQFLNSLPVIIPESVWNTKRDNLPWTLKLAEFSISTTGLNQNLESEFILEPVSTSCTLGLSLKKSSASEDNVGFAIHTDMSPIQAHIRDHQLLFLVSLCDDILGCFAKMYPSLLLPMPSSNSESGSTIDPVNVPLSSHDGSTTTTAPSMPRPPMESWSESTSTAHLFQDTVEAFKDQPLGPFSLWIQWTVPGISVQVSALDQGIPVRLRLDMEDCQASFDWTKIYFKMKGRVQAIGIRHLVRQSTNSWRPGENHGIVVSCSDEITHDLHFNNAKTNNVEQLPHARHFGSEATFFSFTFTRAESSNIRKKWNQLMRRKTPANSLPLDDLDQTERFVSEIDVKVAPFDVVLAPSVVLPFIRLFSHILQLKILQIPNISMDPAQRGPRNKMIGMSINNNSAPMAYLQTQTIRVFLLSDSQNTCPVPHQPALKPNFVLFTLDSISVSPQVDNPLTRIMVRPDLYQMALPVLNLPGAHIEDRQYSIDFGGLGVFTGDWTDVLEKSERPVKPVLKTMGENPALEWNTTKELSDQIDQKEVLLLPCLSKFDLKITAAPAIVLHSRKNGRDNYKLVAGHSLEVNAASEVAFFLSLAQIELLSSLTLEAIKTVMLVNAKFDLSKIRKIDSGIDCDASSQSKIQPASSLEVPSVPKETKPIRFVPFEALITGSKITLSLFRLNEEQRGATQKDRQMWRKYKYKQRRLEILQERSQLTEESDVASEGENESTDLPDLALKKTLNDYDASEEESVVETKKEVIKLYPLAQMGVSQPHIFTSCSSNQQKLDISFYDAYVNLAPPDYFITCGGRKLPEVKDFPIHWVQTKPGDANPKSGVPPPLFAFSMSNFITLPMEVKVKIERPLKFALGLDLLKQFHGLWQDIDQACHLKDLGFLFSNQSFQQSPKTRIPPNHLAQARHSLSILSSVSVSTKQIVLHFPVSEKGALISTEVVVGLMGIQTSATLRSKSSKGQQIVDFVDSRLKVEQLLTHICYCGTSHQFTGPWTANLKMSSIWLPHDPIPNVTFKVDSDLLVIHMGPSHILALDVVREYVEDFPFLAKSSGEPLKTTADESLPFIPKSEDIQLEQSYVDDLRAGAFQYVSNESSEDPKPYQVVFQRKTISAMTWKYPQPRTLTRVSVFPVPFMSASESGRHSNQEDEIICALQYWDGCMGSFLTYSTFKLSEFDVSHLSLPTTKDRQRCAFSDMWRVVLHWDPDQQDFDSLDREIIVTPKSLVSVMRVDSYFNPNMIPRIQGSIHLPSVVLNLSNHLHFHGQKLARQYGNYQLKEDHPMDQPVATLQLDSSLLGVDIWAKSPNSLDMSINARLKTSPSVTVIDYAYLGSHHIVLPTKIQVQANWNRNEKTDELNLGINSKPLTMRYGHFAHHTIQKTMSVWNQVLNREGDAKLDPTILREDCVFPLTHYLVCNNTQGSIRFGQVNTEENHLLLPQQAFMYAWRSPKASLKLRVCVEGGLWQWCEAFPLSHPKTFVTNIDNGEQTTSLVVSIRSITTTERQIVIQGLLSAASLLKDHLELKVIRLDTRLNEAKSTETVSQLEQRAIVGSFSSAPSFLLNPDQVQGIKIRLLGIGTPWSGEIPLHISRGRNNSVLVRIPTKEKGACLTVWCRVAEEIHSGMRRCLLLFSPMYMARSLLPNPMSILITLPGQNQPPTVMEILGRDVPVQLETSKPSDQKYDLSFKVVESLPASNPVPMSWGMIEQVRHGKPEPMVDIDEIIQSVPKLGSQHLDTEWPFINDPDMKLSLLEWAINEQPKTEVQVNFAAFHPLCNTLCVDINPWCLIVNQLGLPLLLKEQSGSIYEISNDSVLVPPFLNSTFHLGLMDLEGQDPYFGPALQLSDQEWRFRQLMPAVQGIVPKEGIIHTKIILDHQICFLTLRSRNENGMRIIHIKPTFCLTNKMKETLQCAPLALMKSKTKLNADKLDLVNLDLAPDTTSYFPLLLWQIVGDPIKDQIFDGYQFIALSVAECDWSLPLNLEDSRSIEEDRRRTVFLNKRQSAKNESINMALIVTVHQRLGQIFICVKEEPHPPIVIYNNLAIDIRFGQSTRTTGGSFCDDKFWSKTNQICSAEHWTYYAFPWLDKGFPFKNGLADSPHLVLTLPDTNGLAKEEEDWDLADHGHNWTRDIDVFHQHEEFLLLPGHGDIKIVVENRASVSYVYIDPVSKIEISAKDIRSRIPSSDSLASLADTFVSVTDESIPIQEDSFKSPKAQSPEMKTPKTPLSKPPTRYHSFNEGVPKPKRSMSLTLQLLMQEVSLALTDDCLNGSKEKDEFVRLTFDTIFACYRPKMNFEKLMRCQNNQLAEDRELLLLIGNIQFDNQMFYRYPYDYPVILLGRDEADVKRIITSTLQTQQNIDQIQAQSLVQVNVLFESNESRIVAKSVHVKSRPLAVNLEDKLIYKLMDIFGSFGSDPSRLRSQSLNSRDTFQLPQAIRLASSAIEEVMSLNEILIEPLDVSVSIHASIKVFIGLEQSPLNFSSFHKKGLRTTSYSLGQMLARHYISGALFRAGWVVGSLDMIGCPSGLTRSVGDGLKDFIALPYHGILQGPWAFIGGMAYGSTSLVKHVSAGTLTSMTSFASSMSRNLDRLSLDQEHCHRNELLRREKPQGLGQGLLNGLSGVGISLLGAVGGLAHHPIHALMEQGVSPTGLVSGLTRGLVGVVTKPLGGAAEFVAQTGQGLLHGTGWSKNLKQRYRSMPDHVCSFVGSRLKYSWKLLGPSINLQNSKLLFMADVIQGKSFSPVLLILTVKGIHIILAEEDAQDSFHGLEFLRLSACEEDPTKFTIHVQEKERPDEPPHDLLEQTRAVKDRITQFVMETSEFHGHVSDLESNDEGDPIPVAIPISKESPSDLTFFSSPAVCATFLGIFDIAKRQLCNEGFHML